MRAAGGVGALVDAKSGHGFSHPEGQRSFRRNLHPDFVRPGHDHTRPGRVVCIRGGRSRGRGRGARNWLRGSRGRGEGLRPRERRRNRHRARQLQSRRRGRRGLRGRGGRGKTNSWLDCCRRRFHGRRRPDGHRHRRNFRSWLDRRHGGLVLLRLFRGGGSHPLKGLWPWTRANPGGGGVWGVGLRGDRRRNGLGGSYGAHRWRGGRQFQSRNRLGFLNFARDHRLAGRLRARLGRRALQGQPGRYAAKKHNDSGQRERDGRL